MKNSILKSSIALLAQSLAAIAGLLSVSFSSAALASPTKEDVRVEQTLAGTLGGTYKITMALERTGEKIKGFYFYSDRATSLLLNGTVDAGGIATLKETDDKGKATGEWKGPWTKTSFKGTWSVTGKKPLSFDLKETEMPAKEWTKFLTRNYAGSINTRYNILFQLLSSNDPNELTGQYRYLGKSGKLLWKGKITSQKGEFEGSESDENGKVTGLWRGRVLQNRLIGYWSPAVEKTSAKPAENSATMPFNLVISNKDAFANTETSTAETSHLQLTHLKKSGKSKHCEFDYDSMQIKGLGKPAVEKSLNEKLRVDKNQNPCKGFKASKLSEETDYQFQGNSTVNHILKDRYMVASLSEWSYTGGAHGNGASKCYVYDITTGNEISLKDYLKPAATEEVKKRILKQVYDGDKEFENEFANIKLRNTQLCPNGKGLTVDFDSYEIGPYALGAPSIDIHSDEWMLLFESNEITKAVFGDSTLRK